MLSQITPLILTRNEAANISRTLARLTWARRIVVVDSLSTDGTLDILHKTPNVEAIQRRFDSHSEQWNFGLDQVETEWALSLDADYVLSDALVEEIKSLSPDGIDAFLAPFRYSVFGHELKASLYPPRPVLFRAARCRYYQDGHTQKLRIDGTARRLTAHIVHDDRKPLADWLAAQDRYALLEVQKLTSTAPEELPLQDKLRRMILPAPLAAFIHTLLVKGMIWEGWPGWYYALQRTVAELILSLRLIERMVK